MNKKIITIVGARPQFIKVAAVSRVLRDSFKEIIVDTGQHYDYKMAGIFFDELGIPKPDYSLNIGSGSHGQQTGNMMSRIEEVLIKENPDAVLVYGDTNSTLAGALVASKLHIPIFHVEAGLRSYNRKMPEEINRLLTDHISSLLFAPTNTAVENLAKEGIIDNVFQVGDVMYDAVSFYGSTAQEKYNIEIFNVKKDEFLLATIHRAENTDDILRLEAIINSLVQINDTVILPLHPRTQKKINDSSLLIEKLNKQHKVKIIDPVSYLEMLLLEKNARAIVTDSGGVQKEAYFSKVPCFTLRTETEWTETVKSGWNVLVDPLEENLHEVILNYKKPDQHKLLYGDGKSAYKIVDHINQWFESRR
ncbi:non-hydrolyzing UDP-N-acetylglucosamine 2-epimerase [Paenibacillus silviterrae]|uniref:non-hydrolyzing UDP-N-acetylglucosamine 2-epimerase n=1 Tax=Paenibacillus silviterrae TaxID=3242194 RepID=UPI002543AF3B|nr:UDP-N-acetylglucosamine 2-epimerase (non-hydrolyzing) [Paenibacillus chinjuensis]